MTNSPPINSVQARATIPTWKLTGLMIQKQWRPYTLYSVFTVLLFAEQLVPGLIVKAIFDGLSGQNVQSDVTFLWGMFSLYLGIEIARLFVSIGYEYYGMTFHIYQSSCFLLLLLK